ncbi:MAG: sulfotransferase [Aequorivita sp.]
MIRRIYRRIKREIIAFKYSRSRKVFCIGMNKTGTTSMKKLFNEMDLAVGPQRQAERLVKDWGEDDYRSIIKYVKNNGIAFQDVPFSFPNTFKILDNEFPDSKFILTIRDSPETWYKSLTNFHSKMFGENGNLPTESDLKKAKYVYPGWAWEMFKLHNPPKEDIYNKEALIERYNDHNTSVMEYFKDKPGKLLVVNLKDRHTLKKISEFLNIKNVPSRIPWENKT